MTDPGGGQAVGDEDDADAGFVAQFAEQGEDVLAVGGVEVSGGFVGQDQSRAMDKGAGDGDALHLAAGKLGGKRVGAVGDPDALEEGVDAGGTFDGWGAEQLEGELDVLGGGQRGKQVEELEDRADALPTEPREAIGGKGFEGLAMELDRTGVRSVDATEAIEEGGLAGTGGTDEGEAFPGTEGEADAAQDGSAVVRLADIAGDDDGVGAGGWLCEFQGVLKVRRGWIGATVGGV